MTEFYSVKIKYFTHTLTESVLCVSLLSLESRLLDSLLRNIFYGRKVVKRAEKYSSAKLGFMAWAFQLVCLLSTQIKHVSNI